ncbi:hypothetical protein [Agaribacter flavus]|uniref:Uncharacterized protein n=1 Tax=Agaribacter flavus TaxID=1902781 RepID=A0ABV7FSP4_9ALTE
MSKTAQSNINTNATSDTSNNELKNPLSIEKLYKERKLSHTPPASIQTKLFNDKKRESNLTWSEFAWSKFIWSNVTWMSNYIKQGAIVASIAIAMGIISFQILQGKALSPSIEYSSQKPKEQFIAVQLHSLKSETATNINAKKIMYDEEFNSHMMTLELNTIYDQKIVEVIDDTDGIKLLSCDNELIHITKLLLKDIQTTPNLSVQPHIGDMMALNLDDQGRILKLDTRTDIKACESVAE